MDRLESINFIYTLNCNWLLPWQTLAIFFGTGPSRDSSIYRGHTDSTLLKKLSLICSQSLIFTLFHDTTLLLVCFRKMIRKTVEAYKMIIKNIFSDLAINSLVDLWRQRTINSLETSLKMPDHRSVLNIHFVFFYICFLHACISRTLDESRQKRYSEVIKWMLLYCTLKLLEM